MKARSYKLKEAHKPSTGGGAALCSVIWDGEGKRLITASSADPAVAIHDLEQPSKPSKVLQHHRDGVTSLALSSGSSSLAAGSIDHSVKLFSFPDGDFQSNVTRFTLPIRCLAFNKSGSLLAAAGDDDGIKLIATIDSSISKVLKGHKGSVSGLAFDPKNEFLASVDSLGTVIYWELSSGNPVHSLKAVAPLCNSDQSLSNTLGWSPDGETLAVPGLRNDVVMYDRDTAEKLFSLKGDHERYVCFLSWSPNGKYMATSGLDKQVFIWDIDLRQDIERQKFDERISCIAWKPKGNALAVIDVMGKFGVWESPVPLCMKSPTDGVSELQGEKGNGHLFFDEDDEKPSTSGSLDDLGDESLGDSTPVSRKRLRKQSAIGDNSDDDSDGQEGLLRQIESRKKSSVKRVDSIQNGREECVGSLRSPVTKMQEPFQPGCTPMQPAKRRFLAYNMLGSITTIENEGYSHIEVEFHDTGVGPRVPSMTDYFGFTMASLSENGSVFANPCKGDKNMSTLMYRPFSSWANNSEWSMRFEGEEVKVVALGSGWVAAVTSLNFLRIFTEGGLQRHILSLNGPVVTAAGRKNEVAVVTHHSHNLPSGDQMLEVTVFDISNRTRPIKSRLPLTPGSCLTWFGYSEEGQLSACDSKGILRVLFDQYGGNWLPVFSASKARKSEDENYWVVGLDATRLFSIVCKSPESYPSVMPKPVLTLLNLSFPLACSDLGADDLESEFIMSNLHLSEIQRKVDQMAAAGLDPATLDDEAFNTEAAIDRCILRLIASCCNGDKLVRATELARLLSLEKSIKGAIKLVTALKLPVLAEKFNCILEERMLSEARGTGAVPSLASARTITHNVPSWKASSPCVETGKSFEATTLTTSRLPQPQISKQQMTEDKANRVEGTEACKSTSEVNVKAGLNMVQYHQTRNPSSKVLTQERSVEKAKSRRDIEPCKNATERNPKDVAGGLPIKSKDDNISNGDASEFQSHRPINPFAKTSKTQEQSSLVDSIKKLKKVETERKNERGISKKIKA